MVNCFLCSLLCKSFQVYFYPRYLHMQGGTRGVLKLLGQVVQRLEMQKHCRESEGTAYEWFCSYQLLETFFLSNSKLFQSLQGKDILVDFPKIVKNQLSLGGDKGKIWGQVRSGIKWHIFCFLNICLFFELRSFISFRKYIVFS